MTITIDSTAQTIAYTDVSNGDSGTVPYSVNSDGTYTLTDPNHNLVAAYEVPSYALLIQAAKTGPNLNAPALITAVDSGQISMSTFAGHSYNYMQFRHCLRWARGRSVTISAQGIGSNSSYWPYGALNSGNQGQSPFNSGTIDMTQAQLDPSARSSKFPTRATTSTTSLARPTACSRVDTPNGACRA